jgi:glycosyltransferase involved in cell wall biosynthesis
VNNIISVITPSYQQGPFIEETIRSVLTQEGDFYIDYIIMDGGSTDSTVDIIVQYENLLQRNCTREQIDGLFFYRTVNKEFLFNRCRGISYRWVSQKDNGQVDALKKGFLQAAGDVFCWINSDDLFLNENVFNTVAGYFQQDTELDLLTTDGYLVDRNNQKFGTWHVDKLNYKELLFLDYSILQPSTFFRKHIYKTSFLDEKFNCAFDADLFIHFIHARARVKKTDDLLSAFRIYPEIKTLHLSKRRYFESVLISARYSKNPFYLVVSIIFKYFSIILKTKHEGKSRVFDKIYPMIYKASYLLITGKPGR